MVTTGLAIDFQAGGLSGLPHLINAALQVGNEA
jgi:hypothetical protein